MPTQDEWQAIVRSLITPIAAIRNPLEHAKRAAAALITGKLHATGGASVSAEDGKLALEAALASDVLLAALLPQDHAETVIRAYLEEVKRYLGEAHTPDP